MKLENKTILLISPQAWGDMFLAKHHYALELAKKNNTVYFLNPPQEEKLKDNLDIKNILEIDNLFLIYHKLPFSYKIKFKWIGLFHFLIKFHIKKIEKKIGKKIDIVWNFDLGHYYQFKCFSKEAYKVFHPIDEPLNKEAINSAAGADIIFSVTKEILEKYQQFSAPKYFLHHGLSKEFTKINCPVSIDSNIRVGLSGNWLRADVDRKTLIQIIKENSTVIFEFWGSFAIKQSNIGGSNSEETILFIQELQNCANVILHGVVHPKQLAKEFCKVQAFLICYDIEKDQSKGTNYHKVMEYLSTGKVIVSNNISTYKSMPNLIEMATERTNNEELPAIFQKVIKNLDYFNQIEFVNNRKNFALSNLYSNKLSEVEEILQKLN
jgi:hypothetical protein